MLAAGVIILVLGFLLNRYGLKAMKDPARPISRSGGETVLWGMRMVALGAGACAVDLLLRL